MGTENLYSPLLPELWYPIISKLPSVDQQTCLSVSKTFHDIATTHVFSHVTISLGLWRPFGYDTKWGLSPEEKAAMKRQADASYEILRHIMFNPDFARKVKKVTVRAHSTVRSNMQIAIRFLADALQAIPDLRAFEWHGDRPIIPTEIIEAIVRSAGNTLQDLSVAACFPERAAILFPSFNCLQSFTLGNSGSSPRKLECNTIRATLEANIYTLRAICLLGPVWEQLPPLLRLTQLQQLELTYVDSYDGLGELISHCTLLRGFALMDAGHELVTVFRAHPHALPNLRAFKLSTSHYDGDEVAALADFLQPKRHLRLLDVSIPESRLFWNHSELPHAPYPGVLPLLQLMSSLPDLHVIGLRLYVRADEQDHTIQCIERYLPRNLTALLLWMDTHSSPVPPSEPWTNLFASYKSLRYLHIVPSMDDKMDLQEDILDSPPPGLELFGCGGEMYPIGRELATGAAVVCPSWPYTKMYFRTANDFGNPDWEWLLRHHGYEVSGPGNFLRDANPLY